MAKQMNMTIKIKNLTEHTVAVARSVVSPKATVPVTAKKESDIESILLNVKQNKISLVKADPARLADLVGFDLGIEAAEEEVQDEVKLDEAGSEDQKPEGEKVEGDKAEAVSDKAGSEDQKPEGEKVQSDKAEVVTDGPETPEKEEPKKPAAKSSSTKKKPAAKQEPKKEEDEQQNLLDEKE